jgi:hypothetical protein
MIEGSDGSSPASWELDHLSPAYRCYGLRPWTRRRRAAQRNVLERRRAEAVVTLPSFLARIFMSIAALDVKIGVAAPGGPAAAAPR